MNKIKAPSFLLLSVMFFILLQGCSASTTTIHRNIKSSPTGAEVYEGRYKHSTRHIGTTPLYHNKTDVNPYWGSFYLKFKKNGYKDKEIFIENTRKSEDINIFVELEKNEWIRLIEGSDLEYDKDTLKFNKNVSFVNKFDKDKWEKIKGFLNSLKVENRDSPLKFILGGRANYDQLEDIYSFNNILYSDGSFDSTFPISLYSEITYQNGILSPVLIISFLQSSKMEIYGIEKMVKVKFYSDDFTFESSEVYRFGSSYRIKISCDDVNLKRFLYEIPNSKNSVIRAYGTRYYYDLDLNNEIRREARKEIYKFIDAIKNMRSGLLRT